MILDENRDYLEETNQSNREIQPTKTFRISFDGRRITDKIDDEQALEQAIFYNLRTERYAYAIFDQDYGVQTSDLIGMNINEIQAVLPNRITECLLVDDRITTVDRVDIEEGNEKSIVRVKINFTSIYADVNKISVDYVIK